MVGKVDIGRDGAGCGTGHDGGFGGEALCHVPTQRECVILVKLWMLGARQPAPRAPLLW